MAETQSAPTGTVCRRGGVQSAGRPVDFVFGFTDTGLLVCSQKAKIQNKHKTQVKYSAKKVWQQGRIVSSSGFTGLKNAATVQNIKT